MDLPNHALTLILAWPGMSRRRVHGVWLFGSYNQGRAGPESDVDLAILCDPPLGLDRTRAMDAVGRELGVDVDIIDLATTSPALAWEVVTTGRLVHEVDDEAVERFVRHARFAAEDWEQRNRMILLAQVGQVGGVTR